MPAEFSKKLTARSCVFTNNLLAFANELSVFGHFVGLVLKALKCWDKFNMNLSASPMQGKWGIKCLKHKAFLWLLHQTQRQRGTLCSKCCFKSLSSPEFTLFVSMQANLMSHNEISCLIKNSPRTSMTLRIDSKEPSTFLIGINPVKCSDTTLLKQNVA